MSGLVCIQYGCGFSAPEQWINYDASPTLWFEKLPFIGSLYTRKSNDKQGRFPKNVRYGNIVTGLPVTPNSVDFLYCSHVLEHLSYVDCLQALKHSHLYLKPDGIFRFVLPDLKGAVTHYLSDPSDDAAHHFMRSSHLGKETRPKTLKQFIFDWLSNASHLWLWDEKSMAKALYECGFSSVSRAYFTDKKDSLFDAVEEPQRWEGCLGFECKK